MSVQTLSDLSNNAMYGATIVYALAFLAHVAEWAMARQLPATAETAEPRRVLTKVGADAPVAPAGGSTADLAADVTPDEESSDRYGRIGLTLTVLAVALHAVGVLCRGIAAERVPWGSMYEFAISASLFVTLAYLVAVRTWQARWLGLLITGFCMTVLGAAVLWWYRPIAPLMVALHSYWLVIHVIAAVIAAGGFAVGGLASILYLVRSRAEEKAAADPQAPRRGFVWRIPSAEAVDRLAYRANAFAFPVWTFAALIAGPIWAKYAWGRAWGWDPKEVWAFITWVVYAAYLHARATAGWKGRAAAWIAIIGFGTLLFNFVGINLFGSGMHTYSGL